MPTTSVFSQRNRRTVASPKNPLDKCTLVSIIPKEIVERKPTIVPGVFKIAAGSFENPAILVIGSSSWWREIDPEQPLIEIPEGAMTVANAIVRDYCNSLIGSDMAGAMPGLFFVPGEHTVEVIKKRFSAELMTAKLRQDNWYRELVKEADTEWAKSNGSPAAIAEEMKVAASALGLLEKPWMKDQLFLSKDNCPACGYKVESQYALCPNCKYVINQEAAARIGLTSPLEHVHQTNPSPFAK